MAGRLVRTCCAAALVSGVAVPGAAGQDTGTPLPTPVLQVLSGVAPAPPAAPAAGPSATRGALVISWGASTGALSYTLQHRDSDDADWSDVATGLTETRYAFSSSAPEAEGTWRYRVVAVGLLASSAPSQATTPVIVDRTGPLKPLIAADRAAEDRVGGWFKDAVQVTLSGSDDVPLPDGSPGVGGVGYLGPYSFASGGTFARSGTAQDALGNVSVPSDTLTVRIDNEAPAVAIAGCPTVPVALDSTSSVTVAASDAAPSAGLVLDPSGDQRLDTATAGAKEAVFTVEDRVGHGASASCAYEVIAPPAAPEAPETDAAATRGGHVIAWTDVGGADSYTLQHRDSDDADWSDVAAGIGGTSHSFGSGAPEEEGTWHYRILAVGPGGTSAPSAASQPVTVDRTGPSRPAITADRAPEDVMGRFHKDTVTLTFSGSADPVLPDGSPGAGGVTHDPPIVVGSHGTTSHSGRATDTLGNASIASETLTVRVDAEAPRVSIADCPAAVVAPGSSVALPVTAQDAGSGLAQDPSGVRSLGPVAGGFKTVTATATDRVGHEATDSCRFLVDAPPAKPGKPYGASVSAGKVTLKWGATRSVAGLPITYGIERRPAAGSDWLALENGISALSYTFAVTPGVVDERQAEGRWVYRVSATDGYLASLPSVDSSTVLVDRTAPAAPALSIAEGQVVAYRDETTGRDWYRDQVTVDIEDHGDPPLVDGTAGSGVKPYTDPYVWRYNGVRTVSRFLSDRAGNRSQNGKLVVAVDAAAPSVTVKCPAGTLVRGKTASARWHAYDGGAGIAGAKSGTIPLDTSSEGTRTADVTVADNVGHATAKSCSYTVE